MKRVAVLKEDFETKVVFEKGQQIEVVSLDLYWMKPEEKSALAIVIGVMEYLCLSYPNGSPTKYMQLFSIEERV